MTRATKTGLPAFDLVEDGGLTPAEAEATLEHIRQVLGFQKVAFNVFQTEVTLLTFFSKIFGVEERNRFDAALLERLIVET